MDFKLSNEIEILDLVAVPESNSDWLIYSYRTGTILRLCDRYVTMILNADYNALPYALVNILIKSEILTESGSDIWLSTLLPNSLDGNGYTNRIYSCITENQERVPLIVVNQHKTEGTLHAFLFLPVNDILLSPAVFQSSVNEILIQFFDSQIVKKEVSLIIDIKKDYEIAALVQLINLVSYELKQNGFFRLAQLELSLLIYPDAWLEWSDELLASLRELNNASKVKLHFLIKGSESVSVEQAEEKFIDFAFINELLDSFFIEIMTLNSDPDLKNETDLIAFSYTLLNIKCYYADQSILNMAKRIRYTAIKRNLINPC